MYTIPKLLDGQYVLTSVRKDLPECVVFAATQKDLRREVLVVSLKPACCTLEGKARFVAAARAQSLCRHSFVSAPLELFEADGAWHLARERWSGTPLDVLMANGRLLSPMQCCVLLREICHLVITLDAMRLASIRLEPDEVYLRGDGSFRFDNPAVCGSRTQAMREQALKAAGSWVLHLVDMSREYSKRTASLALRMVQTQASSALTAVNFSEEVSILQYQMGFTGAASSKIAPKT